jgi:hypothetical protein
MYICLSLLPDYCSELLAALVGTSSSDSSNRSSKVKLDQKQLLKHIAQEIFIEDVFNLGTDESGK